MAHADKPARKTATAELCDLDAAALGRLMAEATVSVEEVVEAHLGRIADADDDVGAWAHVDRDFALHQARALDRHRKYGRPLGPLHGVPVGVKDIVHVKGLPCENGTAIDAARRPPRDATCVAQLRQAGAVILGKTVTTELAAYTPGKTRNPHDRGRTPGGSSSGSAAAVAANMVPLAIGSQTNGSVIRPASYCGVVGYMPTRGVVSRYGALVQSPTLDTMGVFARTVEDAAIMVDAMTGYDDRDPAMEPVSRPQLHAQMMVPPPVPPKLAFVPTPVWGETEQDLRVGFDELLVELGDRVDRVDLPKTFEHGHSMHRAIHLSELARNYARYEKHGRDQLSPALQKLFDEGRTVSAIDYIVAQDGVALLNDALKELFSRYSAIITPAAAGEAPLGLDSTGSPAFCTLWTYCGVPAITLPLLVGANGLPIGVQLVGRRGDDARLLRTARWLVERLRVEADDGGD
jgi:Asp-tRNA(Asn)/Glu-tRNA(Gln) amidotransferase A subunit family amidase